MAERQLHLNAFVYYAGHHEAAWRLPTSGAERLGDLSYWVELAQVAERGRLDAIFLADAPAYDDRQVRFSAINSLEPISLLSALAAATSHIGLIGTASTTYTEPFNLGRQLATLDHLSGGRAGWNIVTTAWPQAAAHFGLTDHLDAASRYRRAHEYLQAITQLFDSWDDEAFRVDRAEGVYADVAHIKPAAVDGEFIGVSGALNIPRSPQGRPVYVQAGASSDGRDFAATWAEVIFSAHQGSAAASSFAADIRRRAADRGRDGSAIASLPGLAFYLGRTEAEAHERKRQLNENINRLYGTAYIAEYAKVDFGALAGLADHDQVPVEIFSSDEADDNTVSRRKVLRDWIGATSPTLLDLLGLYAGSRGHLTVVGTPTQVADTIEQWWRSGAADGFNLMPPVYPDGLVEFVDQVIPILTDRGIFRADYAEKTLRDRFGLPRPEVHHQRDVGLLAAPAKTATATTAAQRDQA